MSNTKSYYARASSSRKRHGGIWTPKNEKGIGCWLSLGWHKIDITEKFAERLSNTPHVEIAPVEDGDPVEGFDQEKVTSHTSTVWSVPNNSLRRTAGDKVFHDETKSLQESGVEGKYVKEKSEATEDDEVVPDSVSAILGDQPEGKGASSSSKSTKSSAKKK